MVYSETGKSQPSGPVGEDSFPTGTVDPRVEISLSPLDSSDWFSFSMSFQQVAWLLFETDQKN